MEVSGSAPGFQESIGFSGIGVEIAWGMVRVGRLMARNPIDAAMEVISVDNPALETVAEWPPPRAMPSLATMKKNSPRGRVKIPAIVASFFPLEGLAPAQLTQNLPRIPS